MVKVNKNLNFVKGVKLFQKNYKSSTQELFRVYYNDVTGDIHLITDQKSNNKSPYISLPLKDIKEILKTSTVQYIVKNKKLIKKPKVSNGLYLTRVYNKNTLIPNKLIYCTIKGQPGILVKSTKKVNKLDFEEYEIYQ